MQFYSIAAYASDVQCYEQSAAPYPPMSEEQLQVFIAKVKSDTSLQEKLKAVASPEAAIEIAKAAGFAITSEDIQSMQSAPVELSDVELEDAAGGNGNPCNGRCTQCPPNSWRSRTL